MKPFVNFTFPSGHIYQVPTKVIAEDRAKNYIDEFGGDLQRSMAEDTEPLFASDASQIADWAKNNMNWPELCVHARLVGFVGQAPADQFGESTVEAAAEMQYLPQLNGNTILNQPLEMIIATMASSGQDVSAIFIDGPNNRKIAFVTARGPSEVVDGYLGVISAFTQRLAEAKALAEADAATIERVAEEVAKNPSMVAPSTDTPN